MILMTFGENAAGKKKELEKTLERLRIEMEAYRQKPLPEPVHIKKENLRETIASKLGTSADELGKIVEIQPIDKKETLSHKLHKALTVIKNKYNGEYAFLSDGSGTIIGYSEDIKNREAETLSALARTDTKNPYGVAPQILKRYNMAQFEGYRLWTTHLDKDIFLTVGFAPQKDKKAHRRI